MSTRAEKIEAAARACLAATSNPEAREATRVLDAAIALPADLVSVDARDQWIVTETLAHARSDRNGPDFGAPSWVARVIAAVNATHPRAPSAPVERVWTRAEVLTFGDAAYKRGYYDCEDGYAPDPGELMFDGSYHRECEACGIGETIDSEWPEANNAPRMEKLAALLDAPSATAKGER